MDGQTIVEISGSRDNPIKNLEINETLIRNINDLPEEEALWYLRKIKEPKWIEAKGQ
jgi:hypothetical protein